MDSFFGLDRETPHGKDVVCVGTYFDNASLEVALSILREAGIPCLQKDRGAGGAMRILAGYNMYGTDLFVREEDAEAARELLALPEDAESEPENTGNDSGNTHGDDENA